MNKSQLSKRIATKIGAENYVVDAILNSFCKEIISAIKDGSEEVLLNGLCRFYVERTKVRQGIDMNNGNKKITIPSRKVVRVKLAKKFKRLFIDGE